MDGSGTDNKWIGERTIRPDGADKVTGRATFGADFNLPGMLWGKVLRSPHAHARIKSINLKKAAALPGVKAAIGAGQGVVCGAPGRRRGRDIGQDRRRRLGADRG
jgi:CO/xanthine dehydrogenase Mo-binding subunit